MTVNWNLIFRLKSQQIQLVVFITFHQNENFLLILSMRAKTLICLSNIDIWICGQRWTSNIKVGIIMMNNWREDHQLWGAWPPSASPARTETKYVSKISENSTIKHAIEKFLVNLWVDTFRLLFAIIRNVISALKCLNNLKSLQGSFFEGVLQTSLSLSKCLIDIVDINVSTVYKSQLFDLIFTFFEAAVSPFLFHRSNHSNFS